MNNEVVGTYGAALLAIAAGVIICFWGYRLLKVALAVAGFVAGALGGWAGANSAFPGNDTLALIVAIIAGILAALLCVWLFFLGIFLLGASAGFAVATAFFGASGNQAQPILVLIIAVVFGIVALVAQKFMIVVATAISGAYLITAGLLQVLSGTQNPFLQWPGQTPVVSAGYLGYAGLVLWLVLAVVGAGAQFRGHVGRVEAESSA